MKKLIILFISLLIVVGGLGAKGKEKSFEEIQAFLEKKGMVKGSNLFPELRFLPLDIKADTYFSNLITNEDFENIDEKELEVSNYFLLPFILFKEDNIFNLEKSTDKRTGNIGILNFEDNAPVLVISFVPISPTGSSFFSPSVSFLYADKNSCHKEERLNEENSDCPMKTWKFYADQYNVLLVNVGSLNVIMADRGLANNLNKLLDSPLSIIYRFNFVKNSNEISLISEVDRRLLQDTIKSYLELLNYLEK